jgi:hypothetical protein
LPSIPSFPPAEPAKHTHKKSDNITTCLQFSFLPAEAAKYSGKKKSQIVLQFSYFMRKRSQGVRW